MVKVVFVGLVSRSWPHPRVARTAKASVARVGRWRQLRQDLEVADAGSPDEDRPGACGHLIETYDWLTDQIAGRFPPILDLQRDLKEATWPFANAAFQHADISDPTQAATVRILKSGAQRLPGLVL